MNFSPNTLLVASLCGYSVAAVAGLLFMRRERLAAAISFGVAALSASSSLLAGLLFLAGAPSGGDGPLELLPPFLPYLKFTVRLDALGAFFLLIVSLLGLAFSRERNIKPAVPDQGKPIYWAVDFNVDPMSSVVVQVRDGDVWILDEIVLRRATTLQACEEFEKRFGAPRAGVVVYGDASGSARQTTGFSDYEVIREFFRVRMAKATYRVPNANPPVRERVAALNAKLCNAQGDTRMFIDPRCRELIADFEQVSYQEGSTQIDKEKDRRRTHLSDALGYLICQEGRNGPVGERGVRLF